MTRARFLALSLCLVLTPPALCWLVMNIHL
jgi:hypothetical protein